MADQEPLITKFTIRAEPINVTYAGSLANRFLRDYPQNLVHGTRPDRHGVIFKRVDGVTFYVYGNDEHVRVRQC